MGEYERSEVRSQRSEKRTTKSFLPQRRSDAEKDRAERLKQISRRHTWTYADKIKTGYIFLICPCESAWVRGKKIGERLWAMGDGGIREVGGQKSEVRKTNYKVISPAEAQ